MRPSRGPAQPVGDDQLVDHRGAGCGPGSSRYSAAIGRDSDSSSIVPAQNRPSGDDLAVVEPGARHVLRARPGTQLAGVEVEQVEAVDQGHHRARRPTRAGRTTRSATASARSGSRRWPGRAGAARGPGCRSSTAPAPAPTRPGTPPARPARPARRSPRAVGHDGSGTQLGRQLLQHPAVDVVGVLLPAEHADRGDAVELHVAQGGEELVPVDVAVADLVVLVDPGVDAGRVDDVAVADVRPVVEAVGDVQVLAACRPRTPSSGARRRPRRRGGRRAGRRTRSSPTAG